MGKQKYISKIEAEWLLNLIEYHDVLVDEEAEKAIWNLRVKAEDVLKSEAHQNERKGAII